MKPDSIFRGSGKFWDFVICVFIYSRKLILTGFVSFWRLALTKIRKCNTRAGNGLWGRFWVRWELDGMER